MSTPEGFQNTLRNYTDKDVLKMIQTPKDYEEEALSLCWKDIERRGGVVAIGGTPEEEARLKKEQSDRLAILYNKRNTPENTAPKTAMGVCSVVAGLALGFWAQYHSPYMGFGEMMSKWDTYYINPPYYYAAMVVAALLVISGIATIFKSISLNNVKPPAGGEISKLDEIKKAKELLDAGAIDKAEFETIKKAALER